MDAPVRYVRSRDGTRIAYNVAGDGPVLVHLTVPSVSHLDLYPRIPGARDFLSALGAGRKHVRMDFRGTGMSDRNIEDHTPDALTDDVEAVLDHLRVERFDLYASGARVTPALGLAVRRPESVDRIVLGYPFTARPVREDAHPSTAWLPMMESNWELFLETTTQRNTRQAISRVREVVAFVKRCMDQRNYVAESKAAQPELDWARAAEVRCPVLVLEFTDNVRLPEGRMQAFADRFPNGRFIALPEGAIAPPYGDPELTLQAIAEFLGPPEASSPASSAAEIPLTPRETEVLRLLAAGRTQPEIAAELVISTSTVSRHVVSLYAKIGAHRRAEAVTWAIRHGLG